MNAQDALDQGQSKLRRIVKGLDALMQEADTFADELCAQGDNATSAGVRAIAGDLRKAGGYATDAYAKGRALVVDGAIARSGDK